MLKDDVKEIIILGSLRAHEKTYDFYFEERFSNKIRLKNLLINLEIDVVRIYFLVN